MKRPPLTADELMQLRLAIALHLDAGYVLGTTLHAWHTRDDAGRRCIAVLDTLPS